MSDAYALAGPSRLPQTACGFSAGLNPPGHNAVLPANHAGTHIVQPQAARGSESGKLKSSCCLHMLSVTVTDRPWHRPCHVGKDYAA